MSGHADKILTGNHAIDMNNESKVESPRRLLQAKIDQIEALDFGQLKQWVEARLRGKDTLLTDMAGNSRAYPLVAVYPRLKRAVREDLQRACLELLNEFVSGRGLTGDAADDLLILSQGLFPEKAGDRLRLLAESSRLFDSLPLVLRCRVLQTLVALGEKLDASFWLERFEKDGKNVAAICFEGLALNSLVDALDFLTSVTSDGPVLDSIGLQLPAFLERIVQSGQEKTFADAYYSRRNRLSSKLQGEFSDWCNEMGISQKPTHQVSWLGSNFNPQMLLLSDSNGNGRARRPRALTLTAAL